MEKKYTYNRTLTVLCFLIAVNLIIFTSRAQTKIDTLFQKIETSESLEKLALLDTLTRQMIRENHADQTKYLHEYVDLANELQEFDKMASKSRFLIQQFIQKGETEKAFDYIDKMLLYKEHFKKKSSEAHLLLKRGGVYFSELNYKKAIIDFNSAAPLFLAANDSIFAADSYFFLGQSNSNIGDFVTAIDKLEKAHELYEKLKDIAYMQHVSMELNSMYKQNGLKEIANQKVKKIIQIAKEKKMIDLLSFLYVNQAFEKMNHTDEYAIAKKYIDSAKIIAPQIKDIVVKDKCTYELQALTLLYFLKTQQIDSIDLHFDKLIELEKGIGHKIVLSQMTFVKSLYYKTKGDYKTALQLSKKYEKWTSQNKKINFNQLSAQKSLADLYQEMGNYKEASNYFKTYIKSKDSINKVTSKNAFVYHQTRFETQQKEKEIIRQKSQIQQLEAAELLNKSKRNTLLILLFSIALIGIGIWWYGKTKRRQLRSELENNKLELKVFTTELIRKGSEHEKLEKEYKDLSTRLEEEDNLNYLEELSTTKILTKDDWVLFKEKFNSVHPLFFTRIKKYKLTESEKRLLALEKLNLNNTDISSILGIAGKSVVVTRYRLRKKLSIPKDISIADHLELT